MRQTEGDGTPQQQEQRRLERRLTALDRETQRLLDAYQVSALELADLTTRRQRIQDEQTRIQQRRQELQPQEAERQRHESVKQSVEEFCRTMEDALVHPSFETKQKILRLVVDRIEFQEDQITIKHLIPVGNVRLCRNQFGKPTPIRHRACPICIANARGREWPSDAPTAKDVRIRRTRASNHMALGEASTPTVACGII